MNRRLGFSFRLTGLALGRRAISSIKRRFGRIIYNHLILYPKRTGRLKKSRIGRGFVDWDMVTCLNELRAYIYGGLKQSEIESYLDGTINLNNISGATSYFCLIEDSEIFRELDGWLINVIHRANKSRAKYVTKILKVKYRGLSEEVLLSASWYVFPKIPIETSCPSFFLAWRAARKSWSSHGLSGVDARGFDYSYD